jgi:hypothetical protein
MDAKAIVNRLQGGIATLAPIIPALEALGVPLPDTALKLGQAALELAGIVQQAIDRGQLIAETSDRDALEQLIGELTAQAEQAAQDIEQS